MNQKIAQHKHCRSCGKAFVGDGRYCSEECGQGNEAAMAAMQRVERPPHAHLHHITDRSTAPIMMTTLMA